MSSASADRPWETVQEKEQMIQLLDPSDAEDQEMFSALSDRSEKLFAAKRQVKTLNRSVRRLDGAQQTRKRQMVRSSGAVWRPRSLSFESEGSLDGHH